MSGDEPVRGAFHDMGFTDEESQRYYDEVKERGHREICRQGIHRHDL